MSTYESTLEWLYQQFPAYHLIGTEAYKPSLDNVLALAERYDHPEKELRFIHVAGTNGKGSTAAMLASILTQSGEKVGLYTSPHILDFKERIRINGEKIASEYVVSFTEKLKQTELDVSPSFFEITWMMGLNYFRDKKCTVVVVETGLGGRLDATNIITPVLSIITTIGIDHTQFLGTTRSAIAKEKAGIIKKDVPVVVLAQDEEVLPIFKGVSETLNAPLHLVQTRVAPHFLGMTVGYQTKNLATVLTSISVLREMDGFSILVSDILEGIQNTRKNTGFYGRLERLSKSPLTYCDVAHNAEGIRETIAFIKEEHSRGKLHLIYGTSSDKDLEAIRRVLPHDAHYYLCPFSSERSATVEQLADAFHDIGRSCTFFDSVKETVDFVQRTANEKDTILIFGSFFLVAEFFEIFYPKGLRN